MLVVCIRMYPYAPYVTRMLGGGGRTRANFVFGRSERSKNIGTDQFFWAHFPVAHEATREG